MKSIRNAEVHIEVALGCLDCLVYMVNCFWVCHGHLECEMKLPLIQTSFMSYGSMTLMIVLHIGLLWYH